eukprot:m.32812 g.32812  ORF g.32812 m.32812 type:complete len:57 (-) comp10942_c0_seq1:182-352(-)
MTLMLTCRVCVLQYVGVGHAWRSSGERLRLQQQQLRFVDAAAAATDTDASNRSYVL